MQYNLTEVIMKKGFTLSEILITLGVVGVVAAMTLPIVVKNYQKHITANKLKSEYNKFSNIITRSVYENGNVSDWISEYNDISDLREKSALITDKYILPYIDGKTKKYARNQYFNVYTLNKKDAIFHYFNTGNGYKIKNGTVFSISIYNGKLILLIDIDNKAQKNIVGKDVFMFIIENNILKPYGSGLSRDVLIGKDKDRFCTPPECSNPTYFSGAEACSRTIVDGRYAGVFCSALIMQDGWEIEDDYPW